MMVYSRVPVGLYRYALAQWTDERNRTIADDKDACNPDGDSKGSVIEGEDAIV